MIYLFRVRVSFAVCAAVIRVLCCVCRLRVRVLYGVLLFKCGYIRFMLLVFILFVCILGYYKDSTLLLLYVADFLLVNIYTLCNRLRNKELRVALVELRRI